MASVAEALNRGDLAKAQMTALFMKVSDLDADAAARLILADEVLAKYSPDEPRDDHGRWTAEGAARTPFEQAAASLEAPESRPSSTRSAAPTPKPSTSRPAPEAGTPDGSAGRLSTASKRPSSAAPSPAASSKLGSLSAQYESNGDPAAISTGRGDHGGMSYGAYQITHDNIPDFITHEGKPWPELQGKTPRTPEFNAAWKAIAAKDSRNFMTAQHTYIKRSHFDVQVKKIHDDTDVDVTTHSQALRNVVWSTAVQHQPKTSIVAQAVQKTKSKGLQSTDPGFDFAVINAVYDERGRTRPDKTLEHFHSSSLKWQHHIVARFVSERAQALRELALEGR